MAQAAKTARPGFYARLTRYLNDVRAEMKRVVWPGRTEVINSSGIVITTLVIFVILILIYDQVSLYAVRVLSAIGGQ